MNIEELKEEYQKLNEDTKELITFNGTSWDTSYRTDDNSSFEKAFVEIAKASPKFIFKLKLLLDKEGQQLFEARNSFGDLLLFLFNGTRAQRVSPKQALEFAIGGNGESICEVTETNDIDSDDGKTTRVLTLKFSK